MTGADVARVVLCTFAGVGLADLASTPLAWARRRIAARRLAMRAAAEARPAEAEPAPVEPAPPAPPPIASAQVSPVVSAEITPTGDGRVVAIFASPDAYAVVLLRTADDARAVARALVAAAVRADARRAALN